LNNTILAATNNQSNSTTASTVNNRKTSVDLCIGNYKKYFKNFSELEKLNAVVKAPKRTQFVPSETNSFLANKIDRSQFALRGLIYFPNPEWYLTATDQQRVNMESATDAQR